MRTLLSETSADPWRTHTARIVEITPEIEGVATYRLQAAEDATRGIYDFQPGQFNMLYLPGVGEAALSMSGDAEQPREWVHTIRVAGNVTQTIASLKPGDTLGVRGPFGTGWPMEFLLKKDLVIVAGGLGMAPLRPVIHHIVRNRQDYGSVWLIIGARTPMNLLYQPEYEAWRRADINVQVTVDRADTSWTGQMGVVTLLLDRLPIPRPSQTQLLTCGPEVMMNYAALSAMRRGLPGSQIWVSMERNMQCAVGMCGHCLWGPALICKDGPVLRHDRVQPYFSVESL